MPQATKTQLANEGENVEQKPKDDRKSLTARVKPERLPILNQRLKLFGFDSVNEMVHAFIEGKFPQITDDRQIDNLATNESTNGQKSLLEGMYNPDFYQRIDINDMYNYYCDILKLHPKTCRDLVIAILEGSDIFSLQKRLKRFDHSRQECGPKSWMHSESLVNIICINSTMIDAQSLQPKS